MLREKDNLIQRMLSILDLLLVLAAFFAAHWAITYAREGLGIRRIYELYPLAGYTHLIMMIITLWAVALGLAGVYRRFRGRELWALYADVCKAAVLVIALFACIAYLFKIQYVSRVFLMLSVVLSAVFIILEKFLIYKFALSVRSKGLNYRRVLIVGTGLRAQDFMELVGHRAEWGLKIIGLVDDEPGLVGKKVRGYAVLGTLADVPDILKRQVVDEVVFVVPRAWMGKIEDTILYCEQLGKRVSIGMDYFNLKFAKARQTDFAGFPLLTFETTSDKFGQLMIKRLLDIVISIFAMAILSPLILVLVILIKMTSKGPVLFQQVRCSLNGRRFRMYKFRTMVIDAEARLDELRKYNEMGGPAFKMTHDPRVTSVGQWLRKFSLDELPQLINIFKGDMSIVGPRPPLPSEVELYETWQRRRLSMNPGLTCLWQVGGRNKISDFNEWMKLDLSYIDNWSLWLDLQIFLKTVPVVIFARGTK